MTKIVRVLLVLVGLLVLFAAMAGTALYWWIGQDGFRAQVERQAATTLGVPLKLGQVHIDWFPVPSVALDDVSLLTQPPLTARRVEARPVWSALLERRLEVATLVVRGAVVPQAGVDALLSALQKRKAGAPPPAPASDVPADVPAGVAAGAVLWLPKRTVVEELTWISEAGVSSVLDARARLGDDGLPQEAAIKILKGPYENASLTLTRDVSVAAGTATTATRTESSATRTESSATRTDSPATRTDAISGQAWLLDSAIGGGTVKGRVTFRPASAPGREVMLSGELETRNVDVSALTAPARPLSGKIEASTALNARALNAAGLADALQTSTRFTVGSAVVHGIDLVKAVSTVGLSRGGETSLSELTGEVTTHGRAAQVRNLVAKSGVLVARGEVAISAAKALSGRVTVDVTGGVASGVTGIPLMVGGTLAAPEVTLTRGAMLGAAIGTAVMPGVGTGAGAKLGDKISRGLSGLFGK